MPILNGSGQEARFLFQVNEINFAVADFSTREAISELFDIDLTLAKEDEIDFDDVIGQPALLTLLESDPDRFFHGIVSEFMKVGMQGRFFVYQARVVPSAWLLSLEQDCRIFQNKTVEEIITQIFNDRGITSDRFDFRLQGSYEPREYCVQYRETDLNFVSRLLEEEGIFYFFEHSRDNHLMVFGDGTVNYQPIPGEAGIPFRPSAGLGVTEEFINDFRFYRQIRTGKITIRDFDFKRPSLDLTAEKKGDYFDDLERYDYPGEYYDSKRGKSLAEIRFQESMMLKDRMEGRSICPRLVPGFTFELTDHALETFNQEYLLLAINHGGSQPQVFEELAGSAGSSYSNHFSGVPSSTIIRPARHTPKPVVEGVQTAIVVGPSNEEIYTDEYGRVKVQFHWDREGQRDEHSSCWIRVSQVSAGAGWGAIDVPRIGHEVIVDFIEGDPDRPIIIGRVYHGANAPPTGLPGKGMVSGMKSNSTPGGGGYNEFTMNDTKGKEAITIHGQYDMNTTVENNRTTTINSGNDTITVKAGTRSVTVKGDTSLTVQAGSRTVSVTGGNYSSTASAGVIIHGKSAGVSITGDSKGVTISGTGKGVVISGTGEGVTVSGTGKGVTVSGTGKGVVISGKGEGVGIAGAGKGVVIEGKGGPGVSISGTPEFFASGKAKAIISSPNVEIGDKLVTVQGTKIQLSAGSGSITIDATGVTIKGALVKIN
jgi:type VI secretion system secreted protein VgrG